MPAPQSKNWCFTWNNYPEDAADILEELDHHDKIEYLVAGREVGESGTPHLQGFVRWYEVMTRSRVIMLLPGCHVEKTKGSAAQAIAYCKKEDQSEHGPIEFGKVPRTQGSGQADRWKRVRASAAAGDFAAIDDEIYCKYINNMRAIHAEAQSMPAPLVAPDHLWIYGETGSGKSHVVATTYPGRYIKNLNKWWDGYTDQGVVHIDEIDPTHTYMTGFLKSWCDKWAFNGEYKGSSRMLRPPRIIVTSNYSIDDMGFPPKCCAAIKRRFTEVHKVREQNIIL